ncbi:hypothetical protein POM88_048571 [Heracleum sosnowskyi]|uniref:Uncharacterized protein n=1 Tax=Heracleum sosnowskyi TaxID=360622 RepID=A0AAD8GWI2_9APIA|nr:hypothetical protein POM88_048571 [Heracleum sosnowskyi]
MVADLSSSDSIAVTITVASPSLSISLVIETSIVTGEISQDNQWLSSFGGFDLVIGSSPCNTLTGGNRWHRYGLEGEHSSLFYEYARLLDNVKSILDMRHEGHYKVFNLCIEQSYDPSHFHGCMERFLFDDNHVPSLRTIKEFCESVDSWLSSNPRNIVVVHCMVLLQP